MAEKINTSTEKLFFKYILDNPSQFEKVLPSYFKNPDILFIYGCIREEYLNSKKKIVASPNQTLTMVKMRSDEREVSKDIIRSLYTTDLTKYEEDWLLSKFRSWKLSKRVVDNVHLSIEYMRELDETNLDNIKDIAAKIKKISNELDIIDDDDDDLGEDFDDPEVHRQDITTQKISTGWKCMDTLLSGGWDYASMVTLIGETNVGKSMWLNNLTVKIADSGKNVLFITLEMAAHKCFKRMGSQRMRIPIEDYDAKSKDIVYMKNKINELKYDNGGMFEKEIGKLFVKKFPTSMLTVTELDNFIHKFEQRKGIKLHAVVIDYINIMGIEKGHDFSNMLFLKGKHLAEGLRFIADKHNLVMITATQTDKSVWGASDINLKDIPESKAIAETSDVVFGIIRNPEMKKHNKYRLKILKLRDGDFTDEQISFDFNTKFLLMENDQFYGTA